MNELVAMIVVELAKEVPSLAIDIIHTLSKPGASEQDWLDLKNRWDLSYDQRKAQVRTEVLS